MDGFIKVNDTLINTQRLLALQQQESNGHIAAHYLAVFDTGQKLVLTSEEGAALAKQCQNLLYVSKPSEGTIATTSEGAI